MTGDCQFGCTGDDVAVHNGWFRCTPESRAALVAERGYMDGAVELERDNELQPRRWQLPDGEVVADAVNREALELLKSDPEEYFRRTRPDGTP